MLYNKNEVTLMKNNSIKAVYDSDLEELLKRLNVYENVILQQCRCVFCNAVIQLDNIDGIIPSEKDILFSCNQPACRIKLLEEMGTK